VEREGEIGSSELVTLEAADIRASRVFTLDQKPDSGPTC
jgi:hypothetical protein